MNEKCKDELVAKYPDIFTAIHWRKPEGPKIPLFLEVGDGWFEILEELATGIQIELDRDPELKAKYQTTQIKEKFGGLRFYTNLADPKIDALIQKAEYDSLATCQDCGSPGKVRYGGWIRTLCDLHAGLRGQGLVSD